MKDESKEKVILEVIDLFERILIDFQRVYTVNDTFIIGGPDSIYSGSLKECVFDWSGIVTSIYDSLLLFNISDNAGQSIAVQLQNMTFSMILFLSAWDALIMTIDPNAKYKNSRRRSGVFNMADD